MPVKGKRSKERKKSSKGPFISRTEPAQSILRRHRRSSKTSQRNEVVRDSFGDDPVTCEIEMNGMDPSDIFKLPNSSEKKRKDSSKSFKTSRSYDRDLKNSSNDLVSIDFGGAGGNSIVIDSTHKFSCLNSKPVPSPGQSKDTHSPETSGLAIPAQKIKNMPVTVQECPKDRVEFFHIFSTLINLGNSAKRDKEREGKISRQHRQRARSLAKPHE